MRRLFLSLILYLFFLSYGVGVFAQTSTVRTKVGNPKGGDGGWPTTGIITQGPLGAYDHGPLHLNALDIANASSPPVVSAFDGTVIETHDCTAAGDCSIHYGNSVKVKDSNGIVALYGHFAIVEVKVGQQVMAGEELGIMGTTGHSTGIHVHYEIIGAPLSPPYVPQEVAPSNCDSDDGIHGIPCNPTNI